jgi:hypothetical protein
MVAMEAPAAQDLLMAQVAAEAPVDIQVTVELEQITSLQQHQVLLRVREQAVAVAVAALHLVKLTLMITFRPVAPVAVA